MDLKSLFADRVYALIKSSIINWEDLRIF
jgi:hypothetical protein